MRSQSLFSVASLMLASGVFAAPQSQQTYTATLAFGVADEDSPLGNSDDGRAAGQILGTGPDGTTYAISNIQTAATQDDLMTYTMVQDATHLSAAMAFSSSDATVSAQVVCGFTGIDGLAGATCTEVIVAANPTETATFTNVEAGAVSIETIEIFAPSGTGSPSNPANGTSAGGGNTPSPSSGSDEDSSAGRVAVGGFASLVGALVGVALLA